MPLDYFEGGAFSHTGRLRQRDAMRSSTKEVTLALRRGWSISIAISCPVWTTAHLTWRSVFRWRAVPFRRGPQ